VTILQARVAAALRRGAEFKEQYDKRRELAYYRDMVEREQQVAKNIFHAICRRDQLDQPNIRYHLSPMSVFNGDLLLAAERPDAGLHILIGDFTGHGLAASIGTLPTSEIFYAMTAKGFDIVDIVAEINRRLRALLPLGMFLAVCAVDIDAEHTRARIWNGGIPDVLVRRAPGGGVERVAGRHLPLGIVSSSDLGRDVDRLDLHRDDCLYLYTDGVIEAENRDGQRFGQEALLEIVGSPGHEAAFDHIHESLERFRGDTQQSDDLTLLEYRCVPGRRAVPEIQAGHANAASRGVKTRWYLRLHLDPPALREFDPRPVVTQMLMDVQALYSHRQRLYTLVAEAFAFALEFGLLGMDPARRFDPQGRSAYQDAMAERLAALHEGCLEFHVSHEPRANGGALRFDITHAGAYPLPGPGVLDAGDHGGWMLRQLGEEVVIDNEERRLSVTYAWDNSPESQREG
jgi:serine phosphatase RsbU (regulator of sigma subunit)